MTDAVIVCCKNPCESPKNAAVTSMARNCPPFRWSPAKRKPRKTSSSQIAGINASISSTCQMGVLEMTESNCISIAVVCSPSLYSLPTSAAKAICIGCKQTANDAAAIISSGRGRCSRSAFRTQRVSIIAMSGSTKAVPNSVHASCVRIQLRCHPLSFSASKRIAIDLASTNNYHVAQAASAASL